MLLTHQDGERPERRTVLVCSVLAFFIIDVVALSETRILDEGRIDKVGSTYSIWKMKPECQIHGVGFAIRTSLMQAHNLLPKAINKRLISLRIPLPHAIFLILISVYMPTLDSDEHVKDKFYRQLNDLSSCYTKGQTDYPR